jgi:hypothetical protein
VVFYHYSGHGSRILDRDPIITQIQGEQLQNRPTVAKTVAVLADPVFTSDDPRLTSTSRP